MGVSEVSGRNIGINNNIKRKFAEIWTGCKIVQRKTAQIPCIIILP